MLIECPFCKAKAKLSEENEGSKVRCAGCGKVYVAHEFGTRAGREWLTPKRLLIGVVALLALGTLIVLVQRGRRSAPGPAPAEEAPVAAAAAPTDATGWDSAPVKVVRDVYEAVYVRDEERLARLLSGPRLAEARKPTDPAAAAAWVPFAARKSLEREDFLADVAKELARADGEEALGAYKPFDGEVIEERDGEALVRIRLSPRKSEGAIVAVQYDWRLVRDGERWKVFAWERRISPEEARAAKAHAPREFTKETFADGTVLFVAEPRRLEHFADTPPEQRARIDTLFARMLDFTLPPKQNNQALEELILVGRPALPVLLTGLYEVHIVDDETAAKINLIDQALKRITGHTTGFTPHDSMGESEQRRDAAVRAWFGWWVRKGETFEHKVEGEDALEAIESGKPPPPKGAPPGGKRDG